MASVPKLKNAIIDMDRKYKTLYININQDFDDTIYTKDNIKKLIQDVIDDIKNIDLICQTRKRY